MSAFFLSLAVIFLAELGDKSQLVALWFATRYRWYVVIAGVTVATLVVHLGSVAIGQAFDQLLPEKVLLVIAGLSFIVFGLWSIRGDKIDEEESQVKTGRLFGAFGVVTVSFFIAELGDKTQLATVSLAGGRNALGVWLGSTIGMVAADALAIGVGLALNKRLPERMLGKIAAVLFFVIGVVTIASAFV